MKARSIRPRSSSAPLMALCEEKRGVHHDCKYLGHKRVDPALRVSAGRIILDFYDRLKSICRGYASLDYEFLDFRAEALVKLDMLING